MPISGTMTLILCCSCRIFGRVKLLEIIKILIICNELMYLNVNSIQKDAYCKYRFNLEIGNKYKNKY